MSNEPYYQEIRVALPLPLDIAGHLMNAVGALWSDATVDTTVGNALVFQIPDTNRFLEREEQPVINPAEPIPFNTPEPVMHGWSENGVLVSQPELTETLLAICQAMFEATPAENYLEMTVKEPFNTLTGERDEWKVILVKPNGKTPHELRLEAEERARDAEIALAALMSPEP